MADGCCMLLTNVRKFAFKMVLFPVKRETAILSLVKCETAILVSVKPPLPPSNRWLCENPKKTGFVTQSCKMKVIGQQTCEGLLTKGGSD